MSGKKLILLAALSIIASCSSYTSNAKDERKNYNKSVFRNYKTLPANTRAIEKTKTETGKLFPGWAVTTDKLNGMVLDIYGAPITIEGSSNKERAQNCIAQKLKTLGADRKEWKQVSNITAPRADYVHYNQYINGHPIVFSKLSFRFTKSGELARIEMKNFGRPKGNAAPAISADEAKVIATKDLEGVTITSAETDKTWSWFPIPKAGGYELHPAWHFKVKGKVPGSIPLILTGYIDAMTGELLYRNNEVKETTYDLTVKGMVYKNGTLNPATLEPLTDLGLGIGSGTHYTDPTGLFSTTSITLPASTSIPLSGKWATVFDSVSGITPSFTNLVALPGTTYTYPTTVPSSNRHVNAYYHVNKIHNVMKSYYPTFTDLDFSLPTIVDITSGTCNAYYTGTDINFFQAGSGCNSFAEMGDVIYHEYGHGISDHFYTFITGTSIFNGALNEANSDIWGLGITRNPVLAENAFIPSVGFIRRYDKMPQVYPMDLIGFDPHQDGQIIAGCWWDVGVALGIDTMLRLFTDVYYDVPDGPDGFEGAVYQAVLTDALMADDNNNNLLDGTPHYAQIIAAFARHGIYIEGDAELSHDELTNKPANTDIPVTGLLALGSMTMFHDLTLYYRTNGTGAWNPVVLSNSGMTFTGTIPGQPEGTTVEYYFVVHDSMNVPNVYFPITCNPAMASYQATLPYQFAVGVYVADSNNFDNDNAGWLVGSNVGDNATNGFWARVQPFAHGFLTAWPPTDHTTGSGECLLTGNGGPAGSSSNVAGGATTVISPVFNISQFSKPIIQYHRWYSNEQTVTNFKNDPWIVKINDGNGGAWQTVEQTYQPDINWRKRVFPVSAYLPAGTIQVQLKFFASDSVLSNYRSGGQSVIVGGIDDVFIYDKAAPASVSSTDVTKAVIFPNPADDAIMITLAAGSKGTIGLYDVTGKKVKELPTASNSRQYTVSTTDLTPGLYNVVLQNDNYIHTKKVVVAHK